MIYHDPWFHIHQATAFGGPDVDYAEIKAATLAVMAKDFATARRSLQEWGQITFWVDKAGTPAILWGDLVHLELDLKETSIHRKLTGFHRFQDYTAKMAVCRVGLGRFWIDYFGKAVFLERLYIYILF